MDTAVTFRFDDSYVAEFPVDRYCPPNSGVLDEGEVETNMGVFSGLVGQLVPADVPRIASSARSRVVGRVGDRPVCVGDMPLRFRHPTDPAGAPHLQNFETAGDLIRWLVETVRRTRFFDDAGLSDDDRLEVARELVAFGVRGDRDAFVIVGGLPYNVPRTRRTYRLRINGWGPDDWGLVSRESGAELRPGDPGLSDVLSAPLYDILVDDEPWVFTIEVRTD